MKCSKCKKEVKETYTNDKWQQVCKECLEKEIYKRRKKDRKLYGKNLEFIYFDEFELGSDR